MDSTFDWKGLVNAIGIILLASGSFAGLSVHATHIGVHHSDHGHVTEIAVGIALMVVGVLVLILNNRKETVKLKEGQKKTPKKR